MCNIYNFLSGCDTSYILIMNERFLGLVMRLKDINMAPTSVADLEGVPWVPWNPLLKGCLRVYLVSPRKRNYIHYGPHTEATLNYLYFSAPQSND